VVIFVLTAFYNYVILLYNRSARISWKDQIIISYSGLRGVIAFVLALLVSVDTTDSSSQQTRNAMITTTLMVIVVTVVFQGTTIRWLVKLLRIEIAKQRPEEELKSLTNTELDLRAEEFEIDIKVSFIVMILII
jgi:NhaP-type Na+/H+ or K+/H+ antiporter